MFLFREVDGAMRCFCLSFVFNFFFVEFLKCRIGRRDSKILFVPSEDQSLQWCLASPAHWELPVLGRLPLNL